jgi:hypothetical protein
VPRLWRFLGACFRCALAVLEAADFFLLVFLAGVFFLDAVFLGATFLFTFLADRLSVVFFALDFFFLVARLRV